MVSLDEKGYVFYEVKFRNKKITRSDINEEIEQVRLTGLDCYKYVFFGRSGFSAEETEEVKLVDIKELYS